MVSILGVIAFVLFVVGIIKAVNGDWAAWLICWVLAAAIGPGGWAIWH